MELPFPGPGPAGGPRPPGPALAGQMGGGGPAGPPPGPTDGGHPGAPDSPKVAALVDQAAQLLRQAEDLEGDVEDKALLADLVARCRKFTGAQQAMVDKAIGAGPGVKLLRKANAGSY